MIYGNITGIKKIVLEELESLCTDYDKGFFIDPNLLEKIVEISNNYNREISVFITRGGRVVAIGIGDSSTVPLANLTQKRGNKRLCGVRCVHTHPKSSGKLSDVDISALIAKRLDCMAAVGIIDGKVSDIEVAYIRGEKMEYVQTTDICHGQLLGLIEICDKESIFEDSTNDQMNTLLVHVSTESDAEYSLLELENLAANMGLNTVATLIQKRDKPDRLYYMGSGKLKETALLCQTKNVEIVVFDHQLSNIQHKNLTTALGKTIIDRSGLILDIFAKNATTNEGKLQVELARLRYKLPMLVGQGIDLSRQRGGLYALGGGGETKLELDRRTIRRQIKALTEKLDKIKHTRDIRRKRRKDSGLRSVVIVGYTNSGKSTLMNYITKAGVLEEDKLFATLDSVGRNVWDRGVEYLLVDTVGFISRLPHEFIEAFKSTLDEARYADLLLHVADVSSPHLVAEYDVVLSVLEEIGAADIPIITVYNKIDKGEIELLPIFKDSVHVSAKSGEGIPQLKDLILEKLKH